MKESKLQQLTSEIQDWSVEENDGRKSIFFKGRQYIPNEVQIRREIVRKFHDHETAGHPGELETYNQTREKYWWPGMRTFIKNYVKGCALCQQFKIRRNPTKPPLMPIEGPKTVEPFKQVSMDFITDLPEIDGFDSILSVVDHGLSKGVILIPTKKTVTAEETAKLLLDNLHKRFGLPDRIISDRGPQFAAKSFRELLKLLKVDSNLSTAYHPQSDGTTERFNQEIETYISIYCLTNPKTWKEKLPTLEFAHNSRRHSDRQRTSFELMNGYTPRGIPLTFQKSKFPNVQERMETLRKDREEALAAHELARIRMAERTRKMNPEFKKGEHVWLEAKNLKLPYSKKISTKREGPFEIMEVLGPVTYRLKLPTQWKIHNVFHSSLLSPFVETETHGPNFTNPPPDIVNGQEEYEVEAIIAHKMD